MSETDDTDVLVLVPPDLFLVDTDSDDSIYTPPQYLGNNDRRVKNMVASDLIHHVNNLESRISLIENTNRANIEKTHFFEPLDSNNYQYFKETNVQSTIAHPISARFGGSSESFKIQSQSKHHSTPIKSRQISSLPSTPSLQKFDFGTLEQKSHFRTKPCFPRNSTGNSSQSEDDFELDNMPSSDTSSKNCQINPNKQSMDSQSAGSKSSKHSRYNSELMEEIDQFLDSVKKTPQGLKRPVSEHNRPDNLYKCGELSSSVPELNFGLRDFHSLPVREEPIIARHFTPLEPQSGTETKRLSLPEVDRLLKEMESTQLLIEQKLRMKEAQFGKGQSSAVRDNASFPQKPSLYGDNTGSVPDLGFGLRDLASSTDDVKSPRVPVHEDRVIKRSMSLCGMNPSEQANKNVGRDSQSNQPRSEPSVPKRFTPRKLELGDNPDTIPDLGFGLINWYKNNDAEAKREQSANPAPVQETLDKPSGKFVQGENPSSIPDLGFGLRDLWTSSSASVSNASQDCHSEHPSSRSQTNTKNGDKQRLSVGRYTLRSQNEPSKSSSLEHSIYTSQESRENKVTEAPYTKKVNFSVESGVRDSTVLDQEYGRGSAPTGGSSSNLLSLSNLWGAQGIPVNSEYQKDSTSLTQKLEEEKYRREHCERLIQHLQGRLLEEQQKLAVAVQVDTGKDQAIQHFHGAWTSLVLHWKELEEQRHSLALQLQQDREHYQNSIADTLQTLKHYESEVSKALDLAQGYKLKCDTIEKENQELRENDRHEIQELHNRIQERNQSVAMATQENNLILKEKEDLVKKMKHLEEESNKDKNLVEKVKKELDKKVKTLSGNEANIAAAKEEKDALQLSLKEEKARNNLLDQQKKSLQLALDESKKKEKSMREEIKYAEASVDKLKTELRDFYQEQVEIVVRDKLLEFQGQLDAAEKSLRIELERREQAITEMAAKQVKQIVDKHQLEIKLLEEKHKEELQLYQLKLAQSTHHMNKLHNKLKSYNSRKGELVEQLHDVMETQWQQALRIINGSSPMNSQPQSTRTQTNGIHPGFGTWPKGNSGTAQPERDLMSLPVPQLQLNQEPTRTTDDVQRTYRVAQNSGILENSTRLPEDDLKKYIDMLLNRSPGNPMLDDDPSRGQWPTSKQNGEDDGRRRESKQQVPTNDTGTNKLPHWEKVDQSDAQYQYKQMNGQLSLPEFDLSRISVSSVPKDSKSGKPPWK